MISLPITYSQTWYYETFSKTEHLKAVAFETTNLAKRILIVYRWHRNIGKRIGFEIPSLKTSVIYRNEN